jgi:hypothetical protein
MQVASRYASELLIFARFNNLIVTFFNVLQHCSRAFSRTLCPMAKEKGPDAVSSVTDEIQVSG